MFHKFHFRFLLTLSLLLCLGAVLTISVTADGPVVRDPLLPFVEQQKLSAGNVQDAFLHVVIDGDTALISSYHSVYVFVRSGDTWVQQAKLITIQWAEFSIALDGDTALVGAPRWVEDNPPGKVYVFVRNGTTWTQQAILTASSTVLGDEFATTLAIQGDTALVSAPSSDGSIPGRIFVYTRSGTIWTEQGHFSASDGTVFDAFGAALAWEGNTLLVGAPFYPYPPDYEVGAVYVFTRSGNTWIEQAKLSPSDPTYSGRFGGSLSLDGNTVLIGSPSGITPPAGSAYIFTGSGSTWTQQAKLVPSDITNMNGSVTFGIAVALQGDVALVDVPYFPDDDIQNRYGVIYEFHHEGGTTWTQSSKIVPHDSFNHDRFGNSFALQGDTLLAVSAEQSNYPRTAAYVFVRGGESMTQELLVNGGFETDSNGDSVPDGWKRKHAVGDGQSCFETENDHDTYQGACTYRLKPDPTGTNKLTQNVNLNNFSFHAGDQIKLTGAYQKLSSGNVQVRVFVDYASLPEDQARITVNKTTLGYKPLPPVAITLKAVPTRIRVQIQNQTTSGKTWFDALSLQLTPANSVISVESAAPAPLIPLPVAP